jgi:hypothetical protein
MNKNDLFEEMKRTLQIVQDTFFEGPTRNENSINKYFGSTLAIKALARNIFGDQSEEFKYFNNENTRSLNMTPIKMEVKI